MKSCLKSTARGACGLGKGHNKKRPLEDSVTQRGNEITGLTSVFRYTAGLGNFCDFSFSLNFLWSTCQVPSLLIFGNICKIFTY